MIIVQQLAKRVYKQRRKCCERMMSILTEVSTAMVIMINEEHFHLVGYVNKQNLL